MNQKVGRPKSENPKNIRINLRLTKEEYESMVYVAERLLRGAFLGLVIAISIKPFADIVASYACYDRDKK